MLRVLLVLRDTARIGGLERVLCTLAQPLLDEGVRVEALVVARKPDGRAREYMGRFMDVVELTRLNRQGHDVVHIHAQDALNWPVWTAVRARLARLPVVTTIHLPSYPPRGAWSPGRARVSVTLLSLGLLLALLRVRLFAPSVESARDASRRLGPWTRVQALDNAVGDPGPQPLPRDFRVCFVGRLESHKEPHTFLDVVERLIGRGIPVVADVVGDGPMRKELELGTRERRIDGRVVFHGWVDRPEQIMANAALLVLTSRHEGAPLVALEAAALARGVVGRSSLEGLSTLGGGVLTVPAEATADEFADLLAELYRDRGRVERAGSQARESYERRFAPAAVAARWAAVYRNTSA